MNPTLPMIRIQDLYKSFGDKDVLLGTDLEVAEGESLVILGGSGSGKSVLLKHIIGLLRPDRGRIEVDGTELSSLRRRDLTVFRRRFGMAFQEGALFDSMTVAENVGFSLARNTEMSKTEVADRVEQCLEMVHLEGTETKLPSQLSGGMRRRVGFARAIALEPKILLFDEPTTGLDPVITAIIDEIIVDLNDRLETTTVTITHDLTSAFRIADRIAMLHDGRIIASASPDDFRKIDDARIQQFLGGVAKGPLTESVPI